MTELQNVTRTVAVRVDAGQTHLGDYDGLDVTATNRRYWELVEYDLNRISHGEGVEWDVDTVGANAGSVGVDELDEGDAERFRYACDRVLGGRAGNYAVRLPAPESYEWVGPTGVKFREVRHASGTYYDDKTPPGVADLLESLRASGERVVIEYGDTDPTSPTLGRTWYEPTDRYHRGNVGRVSRSTGSKPCAILVHNRRSFGGGAILTSNIVAIRLARGGRYLYRHPRYHVTPAPGDGEAAQAEQIRRDWAEVTS